VIASVRGEAVVSVRADRGHAVLAAPALSGVLPVSSDIEQDWARVTFAGQLFRFLLGAPAMTHLERVVPLAGGAYVERDTLFLPLQWLTGYIPSVLREAYRYDPLAGRFEEAAVTPVVTRTPVARPATAASRPTGPNAGRLLPSGVLKMPHKVVVDAGHGGHDPGNPGIYLPRGLKEKDVTLAIAKLLRTELQRRGIEVVMTRTTDTLIDLHDRGQFCRDDCDLFLSIHVNSLPRRRGNERVSGFETYFLAAARTAEADRVARMENEALRYEADSPANRANGDALDFILKDLQTNEYLRESAVLADLVQTYGGRVHPGGSRDVSQAGFIVLTTARRPAVLIETGFSTNRTDGAFLGSRNGQQKLASAIADAVVAYFQKYEAKIASGAAP
jgi:N-acetylmuramoyl-L-alanine amidase